MMRSILWAFHREQLCDISFLAQMAELFICRSECCLCGSGC